MTGNVGLSAAADEYDARPVWSKPELNLWEIEHVTETNFSFRGHYDGVSTGGLHYTGS